MADDSEMKITTIWETSRMQTSERALVLYYNIIRSFPVFFPLDFHC